MSRKRANVSGQMSREVYEAQSDASEEQQAPGSFSRADAAELAQRRIVRVNRGAMMERAESQQKRSNPFQHFTGFSQHVSASGAPAAAPSGGGGGDSSVGRPIASAAPFSFSFGASAGPSATAPADKPAPVVPATAASSAKAPSDRLRSLNATFRKWVEGQAVRNPSADWSVGLEAYLRYAAELQGGVGSQATNGAATSAKPSSDKPAASASKPAASEAKPSAFMFGSTAPSTVGAGMSFGSSSSSGSGSSGSAGGVGPSKFVFGGTTDGSKDSKAVPASGGGSSSGSGSGGAGAPSFSFGGTGSSKSTLSGSGSASEAGASVLGLGRSTESSKDASKKATTSGTDGGGGSSLAGAPSFSFNVSSTPAPAPAPAPASSFAGFSFSTTAPAAASTSTSAGFAFGGSAPASTSAGFSFLAPAGASAFGAPSTAPGGASAGGEEGGGDDDAPLPAEDDAGPVAKAENEEEDELLQVRAACHTWRPPSDDDKEGTWVNMGAGNLQLLQHKKNGKRRMLLRNDVGMPVLNTWMHMVTKVEPVNATKTRVAYAVKEKSLTMSILRTKTDDETKVLRAKLHEYAAKK